MHPGGLDTEARNTPKVLDIKEIMKREEENCQLSEPRN